MAGLFASHALHYEVTIRARFGSTVCALVSCRLGIAIVDEFTLATDLWLRFTGARHCRPDRISDLCRTPQGYPAFEPWRAICRGFARSNEGCSAIAATKK